MSLLESLHNEKVVRLLEKIDTDLKDITEPSMESNAIFYKIIMIIESLLKNIKHPNSHIGNYLERYFDNQRNIDDYNEDIKMKGVELSKLQHKIDMINAELKDLKYRPLELKDFIEEPSFKIDEKGHEGWLFEKLKKELVENNKLNYNYGRDKQK
jgi:predicted nuclease with TOPRIM domain|tara:strand:+ start:2222 stop:2686 length:465 start_codon:yes stop_codon:yes gene_type:complete